MEIDDSLSRDDQEGARVPTVSDRILPAADEATGGGGGGGGGPEEAMSGGQGHTEDGGEIADMVPLAFQGIGLARGPGVVAHRFHDTPRATSRASVRQPVYRASLAEGHGRPGR